MKHINSQNSQEMDAESAKASMGISTRLLDQLMHQNASQAPPEALVSSLEAPGTPEKLEPQEDMMTPRMEALEGKFGELEKEVKKTIKDEIGTLKETIQKALTEEDVEKEQT